jgi:asparagine synthase (glutamine-hydrolysing)
MCGICGFYGKKDRSLLEGMTKTLAHRGPDDQGFYEDEFVSLGHRRLSIIDLSPAGHQPIQNEDGSMQLVFNGEIYNFKELKSDLAAKGHKFRSKTDSEVIVHLYEEFGDDFLKYLNGMFGLCLWDKKEKKLILARDRIGIKPLYYTQTKNRFLFASEIKSILKDREIKKEISPEGFDIFMAFQCIPNNSTMFRGIEKVPPANMLVFQDGRIQLKQYWKPEPKEIELKNITEKIKDLLTDSVKLRLISDVPLGVLLSGGLDSSALVALASKIKQEPLETFSVGFGEANDELPYAKIVAKRFNTNHHEFIVRPKSLEGLLDKIVWHMDEPLADGGAVATYLVSEIVKDQVKVVLVGEGSDEVFGGYSWHKLANFPVNLLPYSLKRKFYFYLTTFYKGQKRNIFRDPYALFDKPADSNLFKRMSDFELKSILPNSLLMKVDKMTMAHSIEARVPFLDHRIIEYMYSLSFSLSPEKIVGKKLIKKIFTNILPEPVLRRRKHGFLIPMNKWLLGDMKEFAQDVLFNSKMYFPRNIDRKSIEKLFVKTKNPLKSIENTCRLWRLFIFELWAKKYLA